VSGFNISGPIIPAIRISSPRLQWPDDLACVLSIVFFFFCPFSPASKRWNRVPFSVVSLCQRLKAFSLNISYPVVLGDTSGIARVHFHLLPHLPRSPSYRVCSRVPRVLVPGVLSGSLPPKLDFKRPSLPLTLPFPDLVRKVSGRRTPFSCIFSLTNLSFKEILRFCFNTNQAIEDPFSGPVD